MADYSSHVALDRRFRDLTKDEEIDTSALFALADWEYGQGTPWTEILESERVVLLAEAGSGKTQEMQSQARKLNEQGKTAFFIPIETLDKQDLRAYLLSEDGHAERFDAWLDNLEGQIAWFFLDSVDELKLIQGKLERALGKVGSALGINKNRARIIISCRPTDWQPVQDMEMFMRKLPESLEPQPANKTTDELFLAPLRKTDTRENEKPTEKPPKSRCVVLLPLNRQRIKIYASARGVKNAKVFLEEIQRREAWSFARRPLDLQNLIDMWNQTGRIGTRLEQHENSITLSLKDNPERVDNAMVSLEMAQDGVQRLAIAMIMTNTRTIRSPEQTILGNEYSSLDAGSILTDWTDAEVKSLLRRPIFDPATYGRVRFHHRTIQEFLAARRLDGLVKKNLTKRQLNRLLFANTYGENIVIPTMQAVASWLSIWNTDVCREVLLREPELLILHGDPESLLLDIRKELIRTYVTAYSKGSWRGLEMPIGEVQRLAHRDLAPYVNAHLSQNPENQEVREFLLKLIWLGSMVDCATAAFDAAMDDSLAIYARSLALNALEACRKGDLLRTIANDILQSRTRWPDRLVHSAVNNLYPDTITTLELETLIRRTPEPKSSGGFGWNLYYKVTESLADRKVIFGELRTLLTFIIWDSRQNSRYYHLTSRFGYLAPALAKLCNTQIARYGAITSDIVLSCIVANWFSENNGLGLDDLKKLKEVFQLSSMTREITFWVQLTLMDSIEKDSGAGYRLYHALHRGLVYNLMDCDWNWLLRALKNKNEPEKRAVALHGLISLWFTRGKSVADIQTLEKAVKDDKILKGILEALSKPAPVNREEEKWRRRSQKIYDLEEARQSKVEQSWLDWKRKAEDDPDKIFQGKRALPSMWTLVKWLQQDQQDSGHLARTGWPKIRRLFGDSVADHFESLMKEYWRRETPPIWSTRLPAERNAIFNSQYAGLTGLSIEAGSSLGFSKFSLQEAKQATKWALLELNGFPEWIIELAQKHPEAVTEVLNSELEAELTEANSVEHLHTLNALNFGPEEVKKLVIPYLEKVLFKWPAFRRKENRAILTKNLHRILTIILVWKSNDESIAKLCMDRFMKCASSDEATVWLQGIFACNLERGIKAFRAGLDKNPKTQRASRSIMWIGRIFRNRYREGITIDFSADAGVLMELTEIFYEHVRKEDDARHEGAYSPDVRDEAEEARNGILVRLAAKPGRAAHRALLNLSERPHFSQMADRLRILARQRAAKDSESSTLSIKEFKAWEKTHETVARNSDELFEVILNKLDDIEYDIKHHDFTDKETLGKITDEREMQPLLAMKILDRGNGHYQVVREDEAAEKKKTDIRILVATAVRAVIEVKIGDNWSVKDFETAIECQLVGQYLRHENCSAGILLITYAERKGFECPENGEAMSFEDVIRHLREFALALEASENGRIRLGVVGIDLRNRLQKNLKTGDYKAMHPAKRMVR